MFQLHPAVLDAADLDVSRATLHFNAPAVERDFLRFRSRGRYGAQLVLQLGMAAYFASLAVAGGHGGEEEFDVVPCERNSKRKRSPPS